eukprot:5127547-Prymnesium_polylepis.1
MRKSWRGSRRHWRRRRPRAGRARHTCMRRAAGGRRWRRRRARGSSWSQEDGTAPNVWYCPMAGWRGKALAWKVARQLARQAARKAARKVARR